MKKTTEKFLIEPQKNTRNLGIDLLKIVASFMVVILHVLGAGGILYNCIPLSANNHITWLLEIISFGAVNLFALSSGYVYVSSKYRFSKVISLWLQVFFYSAGITLFFYIVSPNIVGLKQLFESFLPITTKQYWYFSSYFCLFIFIPFINMFINNLTKENYQKLIILILIPFCGITWISSIFHTDPFSVGNGYSFIWLMALYIIGAYVKIYENDFKKDTKIKNLLLYIIITLISFLFSTIIHKILGAANYRAFFIAYPSPFIVFASIELFLFFSKLEIKRFQKAIIKIANLSFGIFLVHCQKVIYTHYLTDAFINYTNLNCFILLIKVLFTAIIIYISSIIIEYLRIQLFKFFKISQLYENNNIGKFFQEKIQNIIQKEKL